MKEYRKFAGLVLVGLGCLYLISCSKMDASYKDYVVPNGISYVGKADSIMVNSGRRRVRISWLRGTDPNATRAVIYWNNRADSITVPITGEKPTDTISVIIDHLAENPYTFQIYTFDQYGHASIKVDALGHSYDSLYESRLLARLADTVIQQGDDAVVKWFAADATSFASEIKYTDIHGAIHRFTVPTDLDSTLLKDFKFGTSLVFRSLYKPDSLCIDTFYTAFDSLFIDVPPQNLNLALNGDISYESSDCSCGRSTNITDGDKGTFWQPLSADRGDGSVSVVIDLGSSVTFNELDQFWVQGVDGISGYKVFYSDDNSSWKLAYWNVLGMVDEEKALFSPVMGRYVRIEAYLSSGSGVRLSEVEIYHHEDAVLPVNLALDGTLSDKSSDASKGRATKLVDGDVDTFWQPLSADRKDDQYIWAVIDLGASKAFNSVSQNWIAGYNLIDSYSVQYSDNANDWQTAFDGNESPEQGNNISAFAPVTARYVKVQFHLGKDGNINIAEIGIYNLPK